MNKIKQAKTKKEYRQAVDVELLRLYRLLDRTTKWSEYARILAKIEEVAHIPSRFR